MCITTRKAALMTDSAYADLLARLDTQAIGASQVSRIMAEDKSRRQADNPEGRLDLYSWHTPEQTTEAVAAAVIRQQEARIAELESENATLAAGSCDVQGGKLGDDYGHSYCTLQGRIAELEVALRRIADLPGELNLNNFDHDDVALLNGSFVETYAIAREALRSRSAS